jgi:hypothetical protein
MQDSFPAGVNPVSFEINVKAATLNPGSVSLLLKNADIELTHLQSEPAFIGSLSVAAGTYTNLSVTLDPTAQLAIVNNSSGTIKIGSTTCPPTTDKTICQGTMSVNPTTINAAVSITLAANSPLGFIVHFDLNQSVSVDNTGILSVSPAIDIRKIVPQNGVVHEQHLVGTITALSAPSFTLQPSLGATASTPATVTIGTDSNTKYSFDNDDQPKLPCPNTANGFACLKIGQTVRVTANVQTDGTLLATQIGLFDADTTDSGLNGIVTATSCPSPATNCFQMALLGGEFKSTTPGAGFGVRVNVNVASGAAFRIDLDNLTLPSGLNFASLADLTVGQGVQIQLTAAPAVTGGAITVTTSRVRLVESVVTGTVSGSLSGTPPQFTLGSLPALFGPSGTTITVKTLSNTKFCSNNSGTVSCQNGVTGLASGDIVSAGGLLFNGATPTMVAEGVLKH